MSEESTPSTLETIQEAKRSLISGGVASVSSAGTSISYLSPQVLDELERQEALKQALNNGPFCGSIQNLPYDSRW